MNNKIFNDKRTNMGAPKVIEDITKWHHDRNLIDGATDFTQSKKLLEEYIEVVAAQLPGQDPVNIARQVTEWITDLLVSGRIKTVSQEEAAEALKDGLGDMSVVQINMCERNKWSLEETLAVSYNEIKDRKGKLIKGNFVKESDLTD